jgi:hypothetical protein
MELLMKKQEILKVTQTYLSKWLELLFHNVLFYSEDKKSLKQTFGPSFAQYDEQVRTGVIPFSYENLDDDSVYTESIREEGNLDDAN